MIPLVRRLVKWLSSRVSRKQLDLAVEEMRRDTAKMLGQSERRWASALSGMREQRETMHEETQGMLREIFSRLGELEQKIAGVEGEMRGRRGAR